MAARAIWKGELDLGDLRVPVKFYSALQDRKIHFRLLHQTDLEPVEQRLVRKDDGEAVDPKDVRKAFPVDDEALVVLQPDELQTLQPETSRDVHLCRFLPPERLNDQWYERPYYLGPDGDDEGYFALAEALAAENLVGIARWVMRRKHYVGALRAMGGYLMMITLRRADQVVSVTGLKIPAASKPDAKEVDLARMLISTLEEPFDPGAWHDEYRERLCRLIEAKAGGKPLKVKPPPVREEAPDLAEALKRSVRAAREGRRVA